MATYQLAKIDETSPDYINAVKIHQNIITNGSIAAGAMVELCRNLKQMRDKAAFTHLGFETFDDYCEQAANIKRRQAYNYISTYERLGPEVLQSNAQLGITKLQLLAQVPETTREEILESGQADELSTRKLKELTEELTKAQEQLSFLEEQKNETQKDSENWKSQWREAHTEITELEGRIEQLTTELQKSVDNAKSVVAKEVSAEIQKKEKEKAAKAIAKANEEAEKRIKAARDEGIKAGREAVEKGIAAVEKDKAAALARAYELEKKLRISGNQDSVLLTHLFSEFQDQFNKIIDCIEKIKISNHEAGHKFQQAFSKAILMMDQRIRGE